MGPIALRQWQLRRAIRSTLQPDRCQRGFAGEPAELRHHGESQRSHAVGSVRTPIRDASRLTTAYRVVVVTYYIDAPRLTQSHDAALDASGERALAHMTPWWLRTSRTPVFTSYDVLDSNTGVIYPNLGDPRTNSYSPNQIGKVNIFVAFRSQQQRLTLRGFSRLTMATAVTPRNLDFLDRYQ